jgi:protein-S-isoprenylcysteine O-methyltransferase Ste14
VILPGRATIQSIDMNESSARSRSIGKTVVAGLVVLIAGYVLLKIVIGIAVAIAGTVAVILAIVAIIWALRVLL